MAKSPFSKRDEQRDLTRRALIKWSVVTGAALGVPRAKIFDILERTAGRDVALAAAQNAMTRSVHVIPGNGSAAWFQLLWPHNAIAAANNTTFAWHRPGESQLVAGTDKPLTVGPDTPFRDLPASRQMTCFQCGNNETHTLTPTSNVTLNGNHMISIASALQSSSPAVIPMITVGAADAGTATGGARPANVANADGIVGLFNSAASRAGGLLANMSDAVTYKAHYDAFAQLNRVVNRTTTKSTYMTAQSAAQFLGTNLSARLQITDADLTRYGIDGNTRANVRELGRTLIVAVKAFKMGLTSCIALSALRDDPHGAFADGSATTVPPMLKKVFDGFMTDLKATADDNTGQILADDTVITIAGDTTKDPTVRDAWPDGTPNNSNMLWVYGAGHLKSGWFGGTLANGTAQGFDATGRTTTYDGAATARYAVASIAFAIAKRDERAIQSFASGITVANNFGRPKDL